MHANAVKMLNISSVVQLQGIPSGKASQQLTDSFSKNNLQNDFTICIIFYN